MKHTLPYGSLDLPEDWEDRSTYQFVSPAKGPHIPLAVGTGAQVARPRMSVLLSRISIPNGMKVEEFLIRQMDELRKALPSLHVLSRHPWQHPRQGTVPTLEVVFEVGPGQQVRQLQFFIPTLESRACVGLTISCSASQYQSEREEIARIFSSFEPATG